MIEERGRARKISRAAAKPTIPAPMIAKSYVMRRCALRERAYSSVVSAAMSAKAAGTGRQA
jgi:hypothetical protein